MPAVVRPYACACPCTFVHYVAFSLSRLLPELAPERMHSPALPRQEALLEVEYVPAVVPPKQQHTAPHDDWWVGRGP